MEEREDSVLEGGHKGFDVYEKVLIAIVLILAIVLIPISAKTGALNYYRNPIKFSNNTEHGIVIDEEYIRDWVNGAYTEDDYEQMACDFRDKVTICLDGPLLIILILLLISPSAERKNKLSNKKKETGNA